VRSQKHPRRSHSRVLTWPLPDEERLRLAELEPPCTPRFLFLLAVDVQFGRASRVSGRQ